MTWEGGEVSAVWNLPARPATILVLGHGAGGNLQTPGLVRLTEALAARGMAVLRFNFALGRPRWRSGKPFPQQRS